MHKIKTLLSWSSGKDCAWALYGLLQDPQIEVAGLFTTVNSAFHRIAMHGVSEDLLDAQAGAIGLPLTKTPIPYPCSNAQYEAIMTRFLKKAVIDGIQKIAFADLYLEEIRRYREENMKHTGIEPIFPIWGTPTDILARDIILAGFRMIVTCVDPRYMPRKLAGREYDNAFLRSLPGDVDQCGENGEFHTFVFDGPIFSRPLSVKPGRVVTRDGFVFADIVSLEKNSHEQK